MNSRERREARYRRRKAKRKQKFQERMKGLLRFEDVFSFDRIFESFKTCMKGIKWKGSVKSYNINHLWNAYTAYRTLKDGTYKFKGFVGFTIYERGKRRDINSIHISDRNVQKCLCDSLVPALSASFIYDNGASLKGKGTDMALRRLKCMLERHYRKYGTEGYALVMDASSYFDNILHSEIEKKLRNIYDDRKMLGLATMYLRRENGVKGRTKGKGLSLGCQPNQIYAVGYQNAVDHYAKEALGLKAYIRYMDDTIIIHRSKKYLKECLTKLKAKCEEIGVVLNPKKTQIIRLSRGVKFLKTMHYITGSGKIVRKPWKKSVVRMRRKLKKFSVMLDDGRLTFKEIRTSYESWKGHIKQFNSYHILVNMDKLFNKLFIKDWSWQPTIIEGGMNCVRNQGHDRLAA